MKAKKGVKIKKEKIFDTLLHRILFMHYPPGSILNELTLAEEFGTSRGPLRDVLKMLEWKKLVVTMPRLGTRVTDIDFQQIIQVFQIRFDIEVSAARLACENATSEHIDRLGKLIDKLHGDIDGEKGNGTTNLIKIDFQFRDIMYAAALNPVLTEISDFLYHLTLRMMIIAFNKGALEQYRNVFLTEMKEFQEIFASRDTQKADQTRRRALKGYLEGVKALF